MTTLFISDLHLEPSRPEITAQLLEFLRTRAAQASVLYILGDLFEAWVGDDHRDPLAEEVATALRSLTDSGVICYFMHGNRDFLIGEAFSERSGCLLLPEEHVTILHGERVLLMHGDSLCTDDHEYQGFRRMVRNPAWQAQFLKLPVAQRLQLARQVRERSTADNAQKAEYIMDVNQAAVEATMRRHDVRTLLHGHTHRPAVHEFLLDGHAATRLVLGDWHSQASVIQWDDGGFELESLPR